MRRRRVVGQLVLRRVADDELRHDREVEHVGVAGTDRRGERRRLLARGGARERRAPDVGELAHQTVDERAELGALARLRVPPRLREEPRRQVPIAVDDVPVDLQRFARLHEHLGDGLVGAKPPRGDGPELGQRAGGAGGEHRAQLALEPQHLLAQAFAFEPARRDLAQQRAHDRRQRMRELRIRRRLRQHQRVVVAQARQVAVAGEHRRTQRADVDRRQAVAGALAGHVEDQLVLEFRGHVHCGLSWRGRVVLRRRAAARGLRPARS